jgi:hypothetical protein
MRPLVSLNGRRSMMQASTNTALEGHLLVLLAMNRQLHAARAPRERLEAHEKAIRAVRVRLRERRS